MKQDQEGNLIGSFSVDTTYVFYTARLIWPYGMYSNLYPPAKTINDGLNLIPAESCGLIIKLVRISHLNNYRFEQTRTVMIINERVFGYYMSVRTFCNLAYYRPPIKSAS